MRRLTYLSLFFAALVLTGCGAQPVTSQEHAVSPVATRLSQPTLQAQQRDPTPLPSAATTPIALVVYHKTGGIAGVDETFTVSSTGRTELVMRNGHVQHGQISAAELMALQQAVASSATTPAQTPQPMTMADGFTYELTLPASDGTTHVIRTVDGATNPADLQRMLTLLDRLRARQG